MTRSNAVLLLVHMPVTRSSTSDPSCNEQFVLLSFATGVGRLAAKWMASPAPPLHILATHCFRPLFLHATLTYRIPEVF